VKMMKILVTAEPQGFGLSSIAKTITSFLDNSKIDILARGLAYDYFYKEGFNTYYFEGYEDIKSLSELLSRYDLLISVNEGRLAILAKKIGLRVIYFDVLCWLWQGRLNKDFISQARLTCDKPMSELLGIFRAHQEAIYDLEFIRRRAFFSIVAGLISNVTFIQDFPPLAKERKDMLKAVRRDMHFIPPIIKEYNFEQEVKEKKGVFISLGGIPRQNNYAQIFAKILKKLGDQLPIKVASSDLPDKMNFSYTVYKHNELLRDISESRVILTPPGFITMFEVFSLKKPILYLPPKNSGQHIFFKLFRNYGLADFAVTWEDIFLGTLSYRNSWETMQIVEKRMLEDQRLSDALYDKIMFFLDRLINSPKGCSRLIEKQSNFLEAITAGNGHFKERLRNSLKSCL